MRKKLSLVVVIATIILLVLNMSCDESALERAPNAGDEAGAAGPASDEKSKSSATGRVGDCSQTFSGTYSLPGYYQYPPQTIDLSLLPTGCVVNVHADCAEVPNSFTITDANGVVVASSDWIGYAQYPGQYGASIDKPTTKSMSFTKGAYHIYTLIVQTQTPPPQSARTDVWSLSLNCNCPVPSSCSDGLKNGNETGVDCGGSCAACKDCACASQVFSGNYVGKGGYIYPNRVIDVSDIDVGCQVKVNVEAAQMPNRFTVKDPNGNTVVTSNWIGFADYYGYHGGPFNTGSTSKLLTFTKGNFSTYYLSVETSLPSSPTQTFPSVPMTDYWSGSKSCSQ
jgi:hypothetical protein